MNYTIDAEGKKLGRVASEVAMILMGKNKPTYKRNLAPDVLVKIENASKLDISEKKRGDKVYTRYSGYPGGLKSETLGEVIDKKTEAEALRRAVYGMLPANKLRKIMLSRLVIEEQKMANKETKKYIEAVGRRKRAVARVRLTEAAKNEVVVNGKKLEEFFPISDLRKVVLAPLHAEEVTTTYSVSVLVGGGGIASQAEAIRLGIARVLVEVDPDLRGALKKEGYLKRDPRKKERYKFGLKKARKAPQWSKRQFFPNFLQRLFITWRVKLQINAKLFSMKQTPNENNKDERDIDDVEFESYSNEDVRGEVGDFEEEDLELSAEAKIKQLRKKLRDSEKEKIENLTGWQRAKADFVNLKKRNAESTERIERLARQSVIENFFPIIDSFEAAMSAESWKNADEQWKSGVESIFKQFLAALKNEGVEEIESLGKEFDPYLHTSVAVAETDEEEKDNIISEVMQKGYMLKTGEIIRSPKVIVFRFTKQIFKINLITLYV